MDAASEKVGENSQKINLSNLTPQEYHKIIIEWNKTNKTYLDDKTLHQLFESQVNKTPDHIAVVFENQTLTYRELNKRANQLAHYLKKFAIGTDVLIPICMERSFDLIIGLLGILKAGGAYVPLDPTYPADRLQYMLRDTQASILLTQKKLATRFNFVDANLILLDQIEEELTKESVKNIFFETNKNNLAYMIYTSGTTGKPKGALNTHAGVCNRLLWMQEKYQLNTTDNVLQKTPYGFDVSVWELFLPLLTGARLIFCKPDGQKDPFYLLKMIHQEAITLLHFVPSMLSVFLDVVESNLLKSVKHLICSGEMLSVELQKKFFEKMPAVRLYNFYGPTEAAIDVSFYECLTSSDLPCVPIGKPIANTQLYILDNTLNPVPIGMAGELYIGGVQVGLGYFNRPDLTKACFVPHIFSDNIEDKLYKTGDLCRWLPSGDIEYLGRIDQQVKIRGFRIELGEIENSLLRYPGIKQAAVGVHEEGYHKNLIAYFIPDKNKKVGIAELKIFLRQILPEHFIPSEYITMADFPLTQNGKLDRKNLMRARSFISNERVLPENAMQEKIAEWFTEVLNKKNFSIYDNFFELGGDSLLATKVVSRIRKYYRVNLSLTDFFQNSSVKELEKILQKAPLRHYHPAPAHFQTDFPLSFSQNRIWFLDQLNSEIACYNIPLAFRLTGSLKIDLLQQAIQAVVDRHEILRTVFLEKNNQILQRVKPRVTILLKIDSLKNQEIKDFLKKEAYTRFNPGEGPLLRAGMIIIQPQHYIFYLTMHHIICDGWSLSILLNEISTFYREKLTNQPANLPILSFQYVDYSQWQHQFFEEDNSEYQHHLTFWKEYLHNATTFIDLPIDSSMSSREYMGKQLIYSIPSETIKELKMIAAPSQATIFMLLLASLSIILFRYSRQTDLVVATFIANRQNDDIENLIGCFFNTLALRIKLYLYQSFFELLQQVKETMLNVYSHQELPFEKIINYLNIDRNNLYGRSFSVMVALENFPMTSLLLDNQIIVEESIDYCPLFFDLDIRLTENMEGGISAKFIYSEKLFSDQLIKKFAQDWEALLAEIIQNPQMQIANFKDQLFSVKKNSVIKKENYSPPKNQTEKALLAIWSHLLNNKKIGIDDDFFDFGGNSLLAIRLVMEVKNNMNQDLPLRAIFESPTVAKLAQVLITQQQIDTRYQSIENLLKDVYLDKNIFLSCTDFSKKINSKIFLTGATGFLGAFLLRDIAIHYPTTLIYCLVRAATLEKGYQRIKKNLEHYQVWQENFTSCIVPVLGDLSQLNLGMKPEQFKQIAQDIDSIIHNGAVVNFAYTYTQLKTANVDGIREMIKLACQCHLKPIHYISTLSVFDTRFETAKDYIDENCLLNSQDEIDGGYAQSKWVAEQILLLSKAQGVPVKIYRPGFVTGDSQTGVWNKQDFFCRYIKACIQLGLVPMHEADIILSPVNYISQTIMHIMHDKKNVNTIFHLLHPEKMSNRELNHYLIKKNFRVKEVAYEVWYQAMQEAISRDANNPLGAVFNTIPTTEKRMQNKKIPIATTNTTHSLANASFKKIVGGKALLPVYFDYFLKSGFLTLA